MIAIAFVVTVLAGQSTDADRAARELEAIEHKLGQTWTSGACDEWGALLAPDWSVIHTNGETITKAQAVETCRRPEMRFASLISDQLNVRVFGDAAVVTGRTTVTTKGDRPETVRLRFTDVFIRRDGRWLVVASHATGLPDAATRGRQ